MVMHIILILIISDSSVYWLLAYQNRQWLYKMMSCILLMLEYNPVVIVTFTSWLQSGMLHDIFSLYKMFYGVCVYVKWFPIVC